MQYARVLILALLLQGCSSREFPVRNASVVIGGQAAVAEVDERFLSVAVDSAQVVGGVFWSPDGSVEIEGETRVEPYDFGRERLRRMAAGLAPAYLRIGGTAADRVYYDLSDEPVEQAPEPYENVMTRQMFDGIASFANDLDYEILFTLAAGPGPRDPQSQAWQPHNASGLVGYATNTGAPVAMWELGNEVNGFPLLLGINVDGEQLAQDARVAGEMVEDLSPNALLAAPSSAFWPQVGEVRELNRDFLEAGGGETVDAVTWHYYPQQSQRCPVATRRAEPGLLLNPANLNEIDRWAAEVERARDQFAPGKRIWLGESGNAQCGGQPGISDVFEGSFWWLDQLGRMAARNHNAVVRQTLSGSHYGLIDDSTLQPRPDYFASLLWRQLMGTRVLAATVADDDLVRVYAHCARSAGPGAVAVVIINLDGERGVQIDIDGISGRSSSVYEVSAKQLSAAEVALNGVPLRVADDGTPPVLQGRPRAGRSVVVGPHRYAFAVVADANAPACR